MASTVLAGFVEVGAGLDQPDAQVPAHLSPSPVATRLTRRRNQALTVDHPELAYRPHTDTDTDDLTTTAPSALDHVRDDLTTTAPSALDHVRDDLTTTAPSALDHVRDDLITTATAIATAIANVPDDNPEILFTHRHPAVPATEAAAQPAATKPGAVPC